MYVTVRYYRDEVSGYAGRLYTYRTELPLKPGDKVIAPTAKGDNAAQVAEINLPDSAVDPTWADKVKEITRYDTTEEEAGATHD